MRIPSFDVEEVIKNATLNEKIALLSGKDFWHTHPLENHNVPSIRTSDGPNGVRGTKFFNGQPATCIPCGTGLASSWDVDLIHTAGVLIGKECKTKGVHCWLGPTVNIQRSPLGGRGFESFSEDPYLSGKLAGSYINGVQSTGVVATIKHFVCNDLEHERYAVNIVVSQRALREIYLLPFQIAIADSSPGALMTAYNRVNGTHASENSFLIEDILRKEWKWKGLVMSDWTGTYSTSEALNAGLDLEMPGPSRWRGVLASLAISSQKLHQKTLDARVRNVLEFVKRASRARVAAVEGLLDVPEDRAINRKLAGNCTVLLKNDHKLLPYPPDLAEIALIGPGIMETSISGGGSAALEASYIITPYEAIAKKLSTVKDVKIHYEVGAYSHRLLPTIGKYLRTESGKAGASMKFYQEPITSKEREVIDEQCLVDTLFQLMDYRNARLGGLFYASVEGLFTAPATGDFEFGVTTYGSGDLYINDKLLIDNTTVQEPGSTFFGKGTAEKTGLIYMEENKEYKLRLEFASGPSSKIQKPGVVNLGGGAGRIGAILVQDENLSIARAVALATTHNEPQYSCCYTKRNAYQLMPWAHNASTMIHTWYNGNETGNGLADVIFGDVNPSAKLPLSFPLKVQDNPAFLSSRSEKGRMHYSEDIYVGYRYYEKLEKEVLFPFGHGLSYTEFAYSALEVSDAQVQLKVKNTGGRPGAEVVQVYISANKESSPVSRPEKRAQGVCESLPGRCLVIVVVVVSVSRETLRWGIIVRYQSKRKFNAIDTTRDSSQSLTPSQMASATNRLNDTGLRRRQTPRWHRTVTGCLTCRRRKAKCRGEKSPCESCIRLSLRCIPSFHSNFKNWTDCPLDGVDTIALSGEFDYRSTPTVHIFAELESNLTENIDGNYHAKGIVETDTTVKQHIDTAPGWVPDQYRDASFLAFNAASSTVDSRREFTHYQKLDQGVTECISIGSSSITNDVGTYPANATALECIPNQYLHSERSIPNEASIANVSSFDEMDFYSYDWTLHTLFHSQSGEGVGAADARYLRNYSRSPSYVQVTSLPPEEAYIPADFACGNSLAFNDQGVDMYSMLDITSPRVERLSIPRQMDLSAESVYAEQKLVQYYDLHLSKVSSIKSSAWNFYTYMLRSLQSTCDSPLRHGILAYTSSHLSWRDDVTVRPYYYISASSAVDAIITDLSVKPNSLRASEKHAPTADKLSLLLSTAFFLTQCDVIFGDHEALSRRMDGIKGLFENQWDRFRNNIAGLDSHILIWLAYYDCRSLLWLAKSTRWNAPGRNPRGLMNIFNDHKAPSLLRGRRDYRKDCFGQDYPENEIAEDVKLEPVNLITDDIISILCNIRSFEIWNAETIQATSTGLIYELRAAKLGELRANIGRIQAECKVIEQQFPIDEGPLDCRGFQLLTATALHLSATILLNRILSPQVRTDEESQLASLEIMNITRRLRKTDYLSTRRSLSWPLPIFVAGIEIFDPFYQDWILDYFTELWDWGTSTRKTGQLLRKVIEQQAKTGIRANVQDVMNQYEDIIII
ncbi:putative beta-glucosidase K [Lachnellula subtilissima]|uniref:beta-glucosidase n=1 Tax=Lachnellula subtilissima TaxID=602034 RepID=A0A8H8U8J8_9HELO|nr:putative beta-glucosidase K [Lachnellula subtilissima]